MNTEELKYLQTTLDVIVNELKPEVEELANKREELTASWRDMWENTVPFSNDFERLTEISQFLSGVSTEALNVESSEDRIKKYKLLLDSPYFGRFDFTERDYSLLEKIYVGRHTVMDKKTREVFVYDWRSPIASIYYRFELGDAEYQAPEGKIKGNVSLKRQYKIINSKLKYYFDSSVRITDGILHEILGRNSSPQMRAIVETIQKEQDIIIRDTESELLIVQGVAGSGKTSIALHRVAFLLYEGLNLGLRSSNVMIISPNSVFESYISNVLPELGEENVTQKTFDELLMGLFKERFNLETRVMQLERIICDQSHNFFIQNISFKGSNIFLQIINRFLVYYANNLIPFQDVYYNETLIETKENLKNRFLDNEVSIPLAKQLKRIEGTIWESVHPLQKKRLKELERIVDKIEGHELEIKQYSRLLAIKEAQKLRHELESFTELDYFTMYKLLFKDKKLFYELADGLGLPDNIEAILETTLKTLENIKNINSELLPYEDSAPLLYLKLKAEGSHAYTEIRQVVIDEAQDYTSLQYEVLKLLFKESKFTVLGDLNQSIEKELGNSFYDKVIEILNKPKSTKLFLKRGFRSTYEINLFTRKLLGKELDSLSFERHGQEPRIEHKKSTQEIHKALIQDITSYLAQGYETIAIICKTAEETYTVYANLKSHIKLTLIDPEKGKLEKGAVVIPSYLAKGLEFDVVIVYDASRENYHTEFDQRLLYIACTRALHELVIYFTNSSLLAK